MCAVNYEFSLATLGLVDTETIAMVALKDLVVVFIHAWFKGDV